MQDLKTPSKPRGPTGSEESSLTLSQAPAPNGTSGFSIRDSAANSAGMNP